MENKYYTPTIEEFHVGFEYEYCSIEDTKPIWTKDSFGKIITSTTMLEFQFKRGVRVKYLDREDIESLGWNYDKDVQITDLPNGYFGELYIMPTAYSLLKQKEYIIIKYGGEYIFKGIAKNKSELKKIMQQVGI